MNWRSIFIVIAILLVLMAGFTITIGTWHFEFQGLIAMIFHMLYGTDISNNIRTR